MAVSDGAPAALIPVQLRSVSQEARDTRIYEFASSDGRPLPVGQPGSHIGLHLPNGVVRQYSLVTCDGDPQSYVVGVKRDANSRGGSAYIYDELHEGAIIQVEPPRNNFPLDESASETIFVAGGIGITPIHSMVRRLVRLGHRWRLFYACRSREDAVFADELKLLGNSTFHFDDEAKGHLDIARIVADAPAGVHLYCCGPVPMLTAFEAATRTRPASQIHVEYFAARQEAAVKGGFTIELAKSKSRFFVPRGCTILQVLRENRINVPASCEQGICAACETRVIAGVPDHRDSILSEPEKKANKSMFVCCSGSLTPTLVLDL